MLDISKAREVGSHRARWWKGQTRLAKIWPTKDAAVMFAMHALGTTIQTD